MIADLKARVKRLAQEAQAEEIFRRSDDPEATDAVIRKLADLRAEHSACAHLVCTAALLALPLPFPTPFPSSPLPSPLPPAASREQGARKIPVRIFVSDRGNGLNTAHWLSLRE